MHISLNWLRTLVQDGLEVEDLAHQLTMAGFEVEDIEDQRRWADGVVVGQVLTREQHPDADRLSVCKVDVGQGEPLSIVCGAQNVRADIQVAVATVGTELPKVGLKLKPTKLRGVPSEGMICSLAELGLAKASEGIYIFEQTQTLGADVRPLLGLDDAILDLSSTANRADALSMVGIAREVKALTAAPLTLPDIAIQDYPSDGQLTVSVTEQEACAVYIGTAIEGVKIGPSPDWLRQRIEAAGVRSINNVVDVTNYVLLEWGQPLHAFDGDRLRAIANDTALNIGVRLAQASEQLKTLDGQTRQLTEQSLVITANDQAVALAGVMGGEESEVDDSTTNLVLEAAWFDPVAVRRSARGQSLRSEASTRYERGVNRAELELACQRAIDLILEVAGGQVVCQAAQRSDQGRQWSNVIDLRLVRVNQLLGPTLVDGTEDELGAAEVEQTLTALGCELEKQRSNAQTTWTVTVPPYRYRDLEREIDLIEEVARLYGYEKFKDSLPGQSGLGKLSTEQRLLRKLRESLRGAGLTELQHYSLGSPEGEGKIKLANPLLAEYSALRTELLTGLVDAFVFNREQGNGALWGFETGRVFAAAADGALSEGDRLAGILGGDVSTAGWLRGGKDQPLGWYEAKGVLEGVFQRLGLKVDWKADSANTMLHPGRTAALVLRGRTQGWFGQLHPAVARDRDLPSQVYLFDLDLHAFLTALDDDGGRKVSLLKPFSSFPASDRDLAFFVDPAVPVADLVTLMTKTGGKLLDGVELFDDYRGKGVPEGQRSLAFRLVYRAGDRTLSDKDVDPVHQKLREQLVKKFKVELRS
ncbi:MAG: phenylalanine--tRNA ligase subunit beta [Synechococcales cyanobacterium RM1_1_8]|nr:phenylalanine--tRNA ligase subunit beta [Synechococcales cyanobacterium RM1_1_8]